MNKYTNVFELDLSGKSLHVLSEDILKYTNLKELNISDNKLSVLPDFLKELKFLKKIDVSNNQLTELPDFVFNYKYLNHLDIISNKISEISTPNNDYDFSCLEVLWISYNELKEIPSWIWKLHNLKELFIDGISLKELPKEIGNLKKLTSLSIQACDLNNLPDSIGYLHHVSELWTDENNLTTLPPTFNKLQALVDLSLGSNNFKEFPKIVLELKDLVRLDIEKNKLEKLPENIGDLQNLDFLNLEFNQIKELPESFYSLDLEYLDVRYDENPLSEATENKLQRLLENNTKESDFVMTSIENHISGESKEKEGFSIVSLRPYVIFLLFIMMAFLIVMNRFNESSSEDNLREKYENEYILAKQNHEKRFHEMLDKAKEVYVYTNDITDLDLTMKPVVNYNEYDFTYDYDDTRKIKYTKYLNEIMARESLGYPVRLNNGREWFSQMNIYNTIPKKDSIKAFSLVVYYKMTENERSLYKSIEKLRATVESREIRKDTVFGLSSCKITLKELNTGHFFGLQDRLIPVPIDLKRKNCLFYFSPLHANVSKEEFSEAISKFDKMLIKNGEPSEKCTLQTFKVTKEY